MDGQAGLDAVTSDGLGEERGGKMLALLRRHHAASPRRALKAAGWRGDCWIRQRGFVQELDDVRLPEAIRALAPSFVCPPASATIP